jgi:hypothetical protein
VILGGDDLTHHGDIDELGELQDGWVYIRKALENIAPQVTRSGNNGIIAALGSEPSTSNAAGAAIGYGRTRRGLQCRRLRS